MQAFWVATGSFSSFALAIVSAAILSRYLSKIEYGTYRQILYVYSTLLIVFAAGLPSVFSYYLPRFSRAQGKSLVRKISRMLLLLGLVFSVTLYLLADVIAAVLKNPELSIGLKYFSPIPMMLLPTLGVEGVFASYKQSAYIAVYNTVTRIVMLLCIVLPVIYFKGTYLHAIYGWLAASVITLLFTRYFRDIPFKDLVPAQIDLSYRDIFSYSLPLLISSLAGIAISSADQFYISRFFGAEAFAEYSNGFIALPFVGMITAAASATLLPEFSRIVHERSDFHRVAELWRSALVKSALIIYPLVVFFMINATVVIELLYTSTYAVSATYFRIAMLLNFFNIVLFAPLILAMGKVRVYSILHILFAALVWSGEFIAVVLFHSPIAIAIASTLIAILKILVFTRYAAHLIKVETFKLIPFKKILLLVLHAFLSVVIIRFLVNYSLPDLSNYLDLVVSFVGSMTFLLATARFFNLDYQMVFQPIYNRFFNKHDGVL